MSCEVTIKMKDKDKSMTKKTKVYDSITADFEDSKIDELVDKAAKEFGGDPLTRKVTVTIKLIED